jgi:hypothetical protein
MVDNKTQAPIPRAQFSDVGRMYDAVIAAGMTAGNLNMDRADTVVRDAAKTLWIKDNEDIHRIWSAGGERWSQLIKDVKSYARDIAISRRKKPTAP